MSHYEALRDQLRADIRTALDAPNATVVFGNPRRTIATYPHAVVVSKVERENIVRSVHESWEFIIELRLPIPESGDDLESVLMESGYALALLLAPYSLTEKVDSGPYANVGYGRYVTAIAPIDTDDTDAFLKVQVTFQTKTTVYQ